MLFNKSRDIFSNLVGSFSDAAVLFPLLILMGQKTGFQLPVLFLSAGLLVIFSGWYYKVPMSVQPLKSIVIAAIAVGATAPEIQMSTLLLSILFFIFMFLKVEKWLQYFSESWIHALQVALGVMLLRQGFESVASGADILLLLVLSVALIYLIKKLSWPILGVIATMALGYSFLLGIHWSEPYLQPLNFKVGIAGLDSLRWSLVANLLLPQLVLTMANSVIATEYTCKHYFGDEAAKKVSKSRLMKIIAGSNFLSALFGGLPMCHGSGGVTALYKGGARHWTSNLYLGFFLMALTAVTIFYDVRFLQFPKSIFGTLLVVIGVYHLFLAKSTWASVEGKVRLLVAVVTVLWTRNLISVLAIQMFLSLFKVSLIRWRIL